jgi:hypothetical protein
VSGSATTLSGALPVVRAGVHPSSRLTSSGIPQRLAFGTSPRRDPQPVTGKVLPTGAGVGAGRGLVKVGVGVGVGVVEVVEVGVGAGLVGVGVGVGVVEVGVGVGVGDEVAQAGAVIVSSSRVTAPLRASARPAMVSPVSTEIEVRARMLPLKAEFVPRVAELPTCQNTLQA